MFKKCPLINLQQDLDVQFDCFMGFCSFDQRCLSIIKSVNCEKINKVIFFINENTTEETKKNLNELTELLDKKLELVEVDLFNPIRLTDRILETFTIWIDGAENCNVLVDTSSFTHEGILILDAILRQRKDSCNYLYAYNNAKTYASESIDPDNKWLSRGIGQVRSIMGYPGDFIPSRNTTVIVILGYECERAYRIIDEICPDKLIIMYNDRLHSTTEKIQEAGENHANFLKELSTSYYYEEKKISSDNPYEAARQVDEIITEEEKKNNVILLPMNNKLSTLAAAQATVAHPAVQVCYAPAIVYNSSKYSEPGEFCYLLDFKDERIILE